jgi:exoribonuclease R
LKECACRDFINLNQLTAAEVLTGTQVNVLVAVANVAALVRKNYTIDLHAGQNTISVYNR